MVLHRYNKGVYDVTMIAVDSAGCMDSITFYDAAQIAPPLGIFVIDSGCAPLNTVLKLYYNNASSTVINWGDGTGETFSYSNLVTRVFYHTYNTVGTYISTITAYGQSSLQCASSVVSGVVNVNGQCQCNSFFTLNPGSAQNVYTGNNLSSGSNLSYLWTFGDGNTSTQAYPTHNYTQRGSYTVCLTVDDGNGCIDTYCDSSFYVFKTQDGLMSQLIITAPSDLGEPTLNKELGVYPNPARDNIVINYNIYSTAVLSINNILGQQIYSKKVMPSEHLETINIANLANGIYLATIKQGNNIYTARFTKH